MLDKPARRKSVNLSIDTALLDEARTLNVNLSRAAEAGLVTAIAERKSLLWLAENREAIKENNRYFEEHGLPFAEYRGF